MLCWRACKNDEIQTIFKFEGLALNQVYIHIKFNDILCLHSADFVLLTDAIYILMYKVQACSCMSALNDLSIVLACSGFSGAR